VQRGATEPESTLDQEYKVRESANQILGDLANLAEQLGDADGLCRLPLAALEPASRRVETWPELVKFLHEYASGVLIPHELPGIARAYRHVTHYEARELIAFDQEVGRNPGWLSFAAVSQVVGRRQLQRLRPLRGDRLVQRYLTAVEDGKANGWHTLVYGLVLGLYSMPLRQGLLHFAQQTLGGFVRAAGARIAVDAASREQLLSAQVPAVTLAVDRLVGRASAVIK
jgi:urease accessory protein UreF